jgi:bla regulator protein blaR1
VTALERLLTDPRLLTLGWALVHMVWQAALAGLLLGVARRLIGDGSPRLSYNLALTFLLGVPLLFGLTLVLLTLRISGYVSTGSSPVVPVGSAVQSVTVVPLLAIGWLVWAVAASIHWSRAHTQVQALVRGCAPAPELTPLLQHLGRQLGLSEGVRALRSGTLGSPCVVGHRRPLVLVPTRVAADTDAAETAALLAHELAHIRRRDYLVNAVQRLVQALFFFHPAVRFIGQVVDEERERCCDDLVVQRCCTPAAYARALARLSLALADGRSFALQAATPPLVARIRRIITGPAQSRRRAPLAVVGAAAVAASLLAGAAGSALLPGSVSAIVAAAARGTFTVSATDPAGEFTLTVVRGRVTEAIVDGRALPRERLRQQRDQLTLHTGPAEKFTVQIARNGITWDARAPRRPLNSGT